jgi:hypothetical protein
MPCPFSMVHSSRSTSPALSHAGAAFLGSMMRSMEMENTARTGQIAQFVLLEGTQVPHAKQPVLTVRRARMLRQPNLLAAPPALQAAHP